MRLNPYLNFDGQCAAAFTFSARCLGGTIAMMQTHGKSPMAEHTPPELHSRVLHVRLELGDQVLMGSDSPPGQHSRPQGLYVMLNVDTPEEAERVFHALAENGTVEMPVQETFWAARYGSLVDQFGTPWMVNCDLLA